MFTYDENEFESYEIGLSEDQPIIRSRLFAGYDPAKMMDGSGFVIIEVFENGDKETRMILNLRGASYTEQAAEIARICRARGVVRLAMDTNGVGEAVHDLLNKLMGGRVMAVGMHSRHIKDELITELRIAFQDGKMKLGKNFRLYNKLRKELHELDPKKLDHPPKGSSDLCWALALANYASRFNYTKVRRVHLPIMER